MRYLLLREVLRQPDPLIHYLGNRRGLLVGSLHTIINLRFPQWIDLRFCIGGSVSLSLLYSYTPILLYSYTPILLFS